MRFKEKGGGEKEKSGKKHTPWGLTRFRPCAFSSLSMRLAHREKKGRKKKGRLDPFFNYMRLYKSRERKKKREKKRRQGGFLSAARIHLLPVGGGDEEKGRKKRPPESWARP